MDPLHERRAEALATHRRGAFDEAERRYRAILADAPDDGETWHCFAVLNGQRDRPADARACCEEALRCGFRTAAVFANLGLAHRALGAEEEARSAFRESLDTDAGDADLTLEYVELLRRAGEEREALRRLGDACARFPADVRMHTELGRLAAELNDGQLAEESFRHAVRLGRLHPPFGCDSAESWLNLGSILLMRGDAAGAEYALRRALELDPESDHGYWFLAQIVGPERDPELAGHIIERAKCADAPAAAPIHFAAARMHERAGRSDAAFAAWATGNRLVRGGYAYSVDEDEAALARLADTMEQVPVASLTPEEVDGPTPLFIVGMPRSGSTLIEQMLAAHPEIHAGGEIVWLQRQIRDALRAGGRAYPAEQLLLDETALGEVRRRYRAALELRQRRGRFITDKLPGNFLAIPTIRRLFPQALVVHARRDALETCWSCFRMLFTGTQRFAYDLAEVGHYCTAAHGFIDRCRARWPDHVVEIRYESLVADPEAVLRALLERLGLEWFAGCLAPDTTGNLIQTASAVQIRAGLAPRPLGSARRYAAWLQPLRQALATGGC